jgi:hypothetical protein
MPIVSHCSAENEEGDGVLWHRWQFSAQSCVPDFSVTALEGAQPLISDNVAAKSANKPVVTI